jgi:uncharacterized membrane protein
MDAAIRAHRTRGRDVGIDLARGLAVLLMFQTHAYDAFVAPGERASFAYRATRELGAVPAPAFLVLAGVGLALAEAGALRRGVAADGVRRALVRRGFGIVGMGYGVSAAYALLDRSFALPTLLRADILHAIGGSIALTAASLVARGRRAVGGGGSTQRIAAGSGGCLLLAAFAVVVPIMLGDPVRRGDLPPLLAAPLALLVDVPGYTRFPVLPLVAFTIAGLLIGRWLLAHAPRGRAALGMLLGGVAVAVLADLGTAALVDALAVGPLTRAHPAVVLNVIDGLARAVALLGAGLALAPAPLRMVSFLVRFGRGSLLAYTVHIPLCYGTLVKPLSRRLVMLEATGLLLLIALLTYAVVRARDALRARLRGESRG